MYLQLLSQINWIVNSIELEPPRDMATTMASPEGETVYVEQPWKGRRPAGWVPHVYRQTHTVVGRWRELTS